MLSNEQQVMLGNLAVNYNLISAVREGRLERTRELINSYGLSYSQAWSEGYVLLCEAVKNNHSAVAKLLLKCGSKVNSKNKKPSNTPLHFAVTNGDIEIVDMILDKNANIDAKNQYGRTPLHNAIRNKKLEVAELLLIYRAKVNVRDNDGITPLHLAVEIGCLELVDHLLRHEAYIDCVCNSICKKGYTPLHFAVEDGNKEVVSLLLSTGANVDVKGENNVTPLHIAAEKGYVCIAKDLLNHGAPTYCVTLKEERTPLHFASELANEEVVKLFLIRGANVNASTKDKLTPLHIATERGHEKVVKLLLEHGGNVDNQDREGKTILYLAVEKGNLMIVEDVLKYWPGINHPSNRLSLKIAMFGCGENYKQIVEALLGYGFIIKPEDANNSKFLHAAVEKGFLNIVEELLKYGADVNTLHSSTCKEGFTPLHTAALHKQGEIATLLVSYGADINTQDKLGKPPIFYTIENADVKITNLLLTNGAIVKGNPELLNSAVKMECIEIVEALLQHDVDINGTDKYGRTALHFTALNKREGFCGFVIKEDPDVNIKAEIAKLLLSKGANVEAQTKNGVTTLHAASKNGYTKVVETLLAYNANVNSGVKSDSTATQPSTQQGKEEFVIVLNKLANVNAAQNDGITALHIATQKGHKETVKVLLDCGAKVDSRIKSDITPLHLGAQKGHQEIIETLLEYGADVNAIDKYGRTALHIASQEGHAKVVTTLLEHGCDINVTSKNNTTALDHAMTGVRSFYSQLNYYRSDNDFYDPLHYVCPCEVTAEALIRHIVKMNTANIYVNERNLLSMSSSDKIYNFQDECEEEIAIMRSEKINNANISLYDILGKSSNSLAMYMRNENIVQVLKSDDYKTKFPIYASMIQINFKKGMQRKELLEEGNKILNFLFNNISPTLPYDCTEQIFNYLSDEDLSFLINAC